MTIQIPAPKLFTNLIVQNLKNYGQKFNILHQKVLKRSNKLMRFELKVINLPF